MLIKNELCRYFNVVWFEFSFSFLILFVNCPVPLFLNSGAFGLQRAPVIPQVRPLGVFREVVVALSVSNVAGTFWPIEPFCLSSSA